MTREIFKETIEKINSVIELHDKLYDIGINIENETVYIAVEFLAKHLMESCFGEEGYEWFDWWLFELPRLKEGDKDKGKEKAYAFHPDGKPIVLDTVDQLYDFLVNLKKENDV